jgi:CRISP-associated protein Cas1
MTNRILDFSDSAAYLSTHLNQLVIKRGPDEKPLTTPLEEIAALVLANPGITCSQSVLAGLAQVGAVVIVCDEKRLPVGMYAPLDAHFAQAERVACQAAAPLPLRKRLWKSIVQAKINSQATLLEERTNDDGGLRSIAAQVRSGDPDNREAWAARVYWPLLFNDCNFHRQAEGGGLNSLLNYGYAVLRGATARAICASGLHPSLGLHHHNRYNAYCLADDLMEPFRPLVDRAVATIADAHGLGAEMNREIKRDLLSSLTGVVEIAGEQRTLFDALGKVTSSLVGVLVDQKGDLLLPRFAGKTRKKKTNEDGISPDTSTA